MTEREKALEEDLTLVCTEINPCLVCGHYKPECQGMEKCELNGWKCAWEWRGVQHERKEAADGQ